MVSVQCCELFAVMPGERVSCVAMITAYPELVEVSLGLQSKAGIFSKHLPAWPVLQCDEQFVVSLVSQPVDVLQTQPVLTVDIAKTLLWRDRNNSVSDIFSECSLESFWRLV